MKKTENKKRINILLLVLLVICIVGIGAVLGKYIIDKTIGDKIKLNIAGTPQGNVLIGEGSFVERDENDNPIPIAGFAYQLKTLMEANSKTLGDVTKIVFDIQIPDGIDKADTVTKIDVSHGESGRIYAYYDSSVDANTVYVVPEELPTDGISYPMMAHEDAGQMFAGLYNLKTIEGLENVFLDNITVASEMFTACRALTAVDLSHWTAEKLTDMSSMFEDCTSLKSLDLTSFNTKNVLTMRSTFSDCSALEAIELDKEKFVTDNVVDMGDMFGNCNSLKAIDVSGFNTANVTDMSFMFSGCESLETLDVSGFDTSSLEYMSAMFCNCALLETIDVSGFKTNNVTDMSDVFLGCTALKSLDLSSWDTSNVTTMWRMFQHCSSLKKLDLSTFNTVSVTDMSGMFFGCTSLNKLYLTDWNTENVTNMYGMFQNCYELTVLDLSSFDTSNVTTMYNMFAGCGALQTIYVSEKWSTEKVVNTEDNGDDNIDEFEAAGNDLFTDCWSLVGGQGTAYSDMSNEDSENYNHKKYAVIDKAQELQQDGSYGEKGYLTLYEAYTLAAGFDFSTAFTTLQMFYPDATTITFGSYNELKQSGAIGDLDWNDATAQYEKVDDESQGTIRAYAITDDEGYTGIYVVSKDSSVIFANQDCSFMFDTLMSGVSLTGIYGLADVDTRNTINMSFMFADNLDLSDMDVSGFDTGNVTNMMGMFHGCVNLSWLDVSGFDTSNVTNMNGMFAQCPVYSLDVSGFDTAKVTNMGSMFASCANLYELDLSKWNTANVTNMASMFDECTSLETIYASTGWNTDNVTDHKLMFDNCTVLVGGQGTAFDANVIDKTYALIDAAREPNGAKGYLTDADYGTKSQILLPGGEFNAELAALLTANEGVTKVQFGEASQFSENLDFSVWDDADWATNADAVLDVARSGNISAFVVGDTVYVLAKEIDYELGVIFANTDSANMFRHNVGDETGYIPAGRLTAIEGLYFVDTSNTTDMSHMFRGSSNLATVDLKSFNTANVTNMEYMFYGCNSLGGLSLSGFDTGKVTNMNSMFYDCDSITALKLSSWDVRNVTNMNSMFYDCDKLNTLDLTGWDTKYVTDMTAMFSGNSVLKTIYVNESWKTGRVESSEDMFKDCTAIVGGQGTTFDPNYTDKEYAVIDRLVSDGAEGYLTYEEAYTLVSGPDFNWMLWDGDGKDEYYGLPDSIIEWEGWDGGDVRITKIVFGSFDEYKETLGLTSWDDLAPGIALDAEQEGNIRLYIPDFDWSNTQGTSYDQTYYVLSKGSSKIIANEDSSALLRSGPGWEEAYGLPWPIYDYHLKAIEGLDKLDTRYVTDMSMMFEYFSGESLDLSNFETSNVTDMSYMFESCGALTSLDVTGFITGNVTNMSGMFSGCSTLTTIDVSKLNTSKVTDMSHMFNGMTALTALNVDNFDTSKVTDMSSMFSSLYVTKLDLSNFNTANVTDMNYMFSNCYTLTDLDILSFDTGKVHNMEFMFAYCRALPQLDISSFSTTGALNAANEEITFVDIAYMFYECNALTKIYASDKWDSTQVGVDSWSQVFKHSTNLVGGEGSTYTDTVETVDDYNDYVFARIDEKVSSSGATLGLFTDKNAVPVGDFTLKKGTEFNSALSTLIANSGATKVQFGSWSQYGKTNSFKWQDGTDVGETENTIKAFVNESDDTIYILSGGTMYANKDSSNMFKHNFASGGTTYAEGFIEQGKLTAIDGLASVNTSNVTDMSHMFEFCTSLAVLDVTSFNTEKVTDMSWMFRDCCALTTLDVSGLETNNVENMQEMFRYIAKVTTLDVSSFNTSKVTNMQGMFQDCDGLTSITGLGAYNTENVQNMSYMFKGCDKLSSLTFGDNLTTAAVTTMEAMFKECSGLTSLDLSKFDTTNVTTMNSMFQDCTGLTSLDVSNFNTGNVWDMTNMFRNLLGLTTLDVSKLDTSGVTTMKQMFWDLQNVTVLDLSNFDTHDVTTMDGMFGDCKNLTTIYVSADKWSTESISNSAEYVFNGAGTQPTKLVGGAGTKWSSSYMTVARAKIDGGTAAPGYLTTAPVTLTTGRNFNTAVENLFSESVTKLQFGKYSVVTASDTALATAWNDSTTYVDVSSEGTIRVFTSGDTVYVLSNGNSEIYANASCAVMFAGDDYAATNSSNTSMIDDYLTEIIGLDIVNTSNVTNMSMMFQDCKVLTSVDVSKFDTNKVTDMMQMFLDCSKVTKLDVSGWKTNNVRDMAWLFGNCNKVAELDVSNWNTEKVTRMNNTFRGCSSLTTLDVSGFNTKKVYTMYALFQGCSGLTELNVSNFDTSAVTDQMSYMFYNCSGLKTLDVSGFDTSNVTNMEYMFYNCSGLTTLDVSGFDTSNVTNMRYMFYNCRSLPTLDVSGFDTSNVANMTCMFADCRSVTELDVSNFDTSNVMYMGVMFSGLYKVTELDVSNWNTGKVTSMNSMFHNSRLTVLDLSSFDTSNVTSMEFMFRYSSELQTIYVSELWSTEAVKYSTQMFLDCSKLVGGEGTAYDSAVIDATYAKIDKWISEGEKGYLTDLNAEPPAPVTLTTGTTFNSAISSLLSSSVTKLQFGTYNDFAATVGDWEENYITSVDADYAGSIRVFESGDTVYVLSKGGREIYANEDSSYMFRHNTGNVTGYISADTLTAIGGLASVNTSNVTNMSYMFSGCTNLVTLDLSKFNTSKVTDMSYMFEYCGRYNMTSLDVSTFDTSKVTNMRAMFSYCGNEKITSLDVSNFVTSNVTTMRSMFNRMSALTELKGVEKFNTSKVEVMREMFSGLSKMTAFDVSGYNTSNVNDLASMFYDCSALTELDLSSFNTSKVKYMGYMFHNCSSLKRIYVSSTAWSTASITNTNGVNNSVFDGCTSLVGGAGGTYASNHISYTYARIDRTNQKGYLTNITQKVDASAIDAEEEAN